LSWADFQWKRSFRTTALSIKAVGRDCHTSVVRRSFVAATIAVVVDGACLILVATLIDGEGIISVIGAAFVARRAAHCTQKAGWGKVSLGNTKSRWHWESRRKKSSWFDCAAAGDLWSAARHLDLGGCNEVA